MLLRSGRVSRGLLPATFFIILSFAFLLSAAQSNWEDFIPLYDALHWLLWVSLAPMSTLLIVQISRVTEIPQLRYFNLLLLVPIACYFAALYARSFGDCSRLSNCNALPEWLDVLGLIIGTISLLTIWVKRSVIGSVIERKNGRERYWLMMALIAMSSLLLFTTFLGIYDVISIEQQNAIRIVTGIAFAYVASTSLFRIYPYAVYIKPKNDKNALTDKEIAVAMNIESLLHRDHVYQEASYNRAKMAKELDISESQLSKIINSHFEKTVPQLLNELRIEDAKNLLVQTDIDVASLSEEAGFNSLATFNRVFKEIEGVAPGQYREKNSKK